MKSILREFIITVALALGIFLILQLTVQSSIVEGSSMEPGLTDGQRLFVNKAVYHFREPQRGEVIIFLSQSSYRSDPIIKRVIGIPGDIILIRDGQVSINGDILDEPYITSPPDYEYGPFMVPENQYFVLGDNRTNSHDSHHGWTVHEEHIIGKAWFSIWPFERWGLIKNYPLEEQLRNY